MNIVKYKMSDSELWSIIEFHHLDTEGAEVEALALLQQGYIVRIQYSE